MMRMMITMIMAHDEHENLITKMMKLQKMMYEHDEGSVKETQVRRIFTWTRWNDVMSNPALVKLKSNGRKLPFAITGIPLA